MKCPSCNAENKDASIHCKKCGSAMVVQTLYAPTRESHIKMLGLIYGGLIVVYFFLNWLLKPYLREIPPEVTPWLPSAQKIHK